MEKIKLKELLFSAINSSILAGIEIIKIYEADFDIEYKEDNSPLTIADEKLLLNLWFLVTKEIK